MRKRSNRIRLSAAATAPLTNHVEASGLSSETVVLAALDQYKEHLKVAGRLKPDFEWSS
jgi:CO dehydrogenase/acetyl-CoA synthase epsilon subunit